MGSETRAPGTLRAPLSPVARTKRGVTNPRSVGEGTGEAQGPQSEYYGNPGSSALIRSAPYLVPSLPGMTREGEEKPGKAPELDRGPHPSPHRAPPSYLVPKRSLRLWGCASYGPQGEAAAAASSGPRCAQMLAVEQSTKGLPGRAFPPASLPPGPIRRPRDGSGKGPGRGATTESWAGQGASGSPARQWRVRAGEPESAS
ncbi:hypothetical protein NN561_000048 [Cricetulus griseus]